jgi:A/G-specific adenine glycosylase
MAKNVRRRAGPSCTKRAPKVPSTIELIRKSLTAWYRLHGRTALPWRVTRDPYYTLVSEFMLQQTQVDRVVPKFEAFVARFPDFQTLARASTGEVLRAWRGLGYNSRAVRLKQVAEVVRERFGGEMPREPARLRELPGVGPYTAAAIRAFAFDLDDAPVDTNVRRIVHRLFFGIESPPKVSPRELDERASELVPRGGAHDWNSAMMDLGASLCTARAPKCLLCPLRLNCAAAPIDPAALEAARAASAKPRSPQEALRFESTTRYARGRIVDRLRELPPGAAISLLDLHRQVAPLLPGRPIEEVDELVAALERDGLVARRGERIALAE